MTSATLTAFTLLDTPLPPAPKGEVLSRSQWVTLLAITDTIIPSIGVSSNLPNESLAIQASDYTKAVEGIKGRVTTAEEPGLPAQYLRENATSTPGFKELLRRTLGCYVREDARKAIRVILSALK